MYSVEEECNFCRRCGGPLHVQDVEGHQRPVCSSCGFVLYLDPKVVVAVLLIGDGGVVLVKRGTGLGVGNWSFPSGYVDRGEVLEDAVVRETREETGLDVQPRRLVGLYSQEGDPVILAVYEGEVVGGELAPGDDVQDVARFPLDALPPLAFPRDAHIIEACWRSRTGGGGE